MNVRNPDSETCKPTLLVNATAFKWIVKLIKWQEVIILSNVYVVYWCILYTSSVD